MKSRWILIAALAVLAIGVGIFSRPRPAAIREAIHQSDGTNSVVATGEERPAEQRVSPLILPAEAARRAIAEQKWASKNNGPVEFYAKVIDQYGTPIQGVVLTAIFTVFDEGVLVNDKDRVHDTPVQIESDAAGYFDFKKDRGHAFGVRDLTKEGYSWTHPGFGSFAYGAVNGPKTPQDYANPNRRLVLQMWRKGATEPTVQTSKRVRITETDSEYAINLLSSQRGAENTSAPDLRIRLRYTSPNEAGRQHDREMVLEAPSGGLVETRDIYLFSAPESRYERSFNYVVRSDDLTSSDWTRKFYLKSRDGRVYAGLEIHFTLFPHVIDIKAVVNPNGSRNLEPDTTKQIIDAAEIRRLDEQTK